MQDITFQACICIINVYTYPGILHDGLCVIYLWFILKHVINFMWCVVSNNFWLEKDLEGSGQGLF
jgi:hypothetical protein